MYVLHICNMSVQAYVDILYISLWIDVQYIYMYFT